MVAVRRTVPRLDCVATASQGQFSEPVCLQTRKELLALHLRFLQASHAAGTLFLRGTMAFKGAGPLVGLMS